jgi:hypothetical protein
MKRLAVACVAAVAAWSSCIASPASAGEPRTHDGFFLRLSGGFGAASTKFEASGLSEEVSSNGSADVNLAVGAMLRPNLAVHGTMWGWLLEDPDVELAITGSPTLTGTLDGDVDMNAIGGGLTYYFMPINVYLTGSVGFATLTVSGSDNASVETDSGFALDLGVGKEWWVGNSWGLGLNGGYSYHSVHEQGLSENWSGSSYAIRFSATLN